MEKLNSLVVGILVITGGLGILFDLPSVFGGFYTDYTTIIELYLFIFSAFLVLKRIFFYRIKGNVEIVQIKKKSQLYQTLMIQGVILSFLYVLFLFYYGTWVSFDTILIGVLLLYYVGQLLLNSNPSIYMDAQAFAFDDYFVAQWKWDEIKHIGLENEKLKVQGSDHNFELDFDTIDEMDNHRLSWEVDASILDGTFAEENVSKNLINTIKNYATQYGISHSLNG